MKANTKDFGEGEQTNGGGGVCGGGGGNRQGVWGKCVCVLGVGGSGGGGKDRGVWGSIRDNCRH